MSQAEGSPRHFLTVSFLLVLVYLALAFFGLPRLQLDAHYHAYFDTGDPLVIRQNQLDQRYESLDQLMLVVSADDPAEGQPLSEVEDQRFFAFIEQLDKTLAQLPDVVGVQSLADLEATASYEDKLLRVMAQVDSNIEPVSGVQHFQDHPFAAGVLLSKSGRSSILELRLTEKAKSTAKDILFALQSIKQVIDPLMHNAEASYSYVFSGPLALNQAYINTVRHDLKVFIPSMLLLFVLLLYACFGQLRIAFMLLSVPLLATAAAFGVAGLMGLKLAAINAFVPVMITSIGVAGGVHLAFAYCQALQAGETRRSARLLAQSHNRMPLFLASLSTALGFLVLSFSPSPPLRVVGYIVAMGVGLNYLLLWMLLPAGLERLVHRSRINFKLRFHVPGLIDFLSRRHSLVKRVGLLLGLASLAVLPLLSVNDNVFEYFSEQHEFRQSANLVDREFSGINVLQFELDSGLPNGILDSGFYQFVDSATRWLEQQEETRKVQSYTQWLQWQSEAEQRPATDLLAAYAERVLAHNTDTDSGNSGSRHQSYRSSSQWPDSAGKYVSEDLSAARLLVFLPQMESAAIIAFEQKVNEWLNHHQHISSSPGGAGPALTFAHLGTRNAHNMMLSLSIALVIISLLCGLALKSSRAALAALACNGLPIVLVYGVWAAFGGEINLGSAVVLGLIMGILVDDSIYVLCAHQRAKKAQEVNPAASMLLQVAPALMITSITLAAGLMLGLASDFKPIVAMSGLSAAAILVALLADLLLLPAIMQQPIADKGLVDA